MKLLNDPTKAVFHTALIRTRNSLPSTIIATFPSRESGSLCVSGFARIFPDSSLRELKDEILGAFNLAKSKSNVIGEG